MGDANQDSITIKNPLWVKDLLNTFFPSLDFSVASLGVIGIGQLFGRFLITFSLAYRLWRMQEIQRGLTTYY